MGQYQQWLHYREVEQQLQAQLETLKKELQQLQTQAQCLEQHQPKVLPGEPTNQILQALAASFSEQPVPLASTTAYAGIPQRPLPTSPPAPAHPTPPAPTPPPETMSSALFGWSNLPNFGPQEMPPELAAHGTPLTYHPLNQSLPPVPHSDMDLLPEDMPAFFDQYAPTDPQIELPHWFRNLTTAPGPIDQETMRNNRLVQRWVERWRKRPPDPTNNRRESS